jgi:hypothetical protein
MISSGQINGVITYLTKLTHTIKVFRFDFFNVSVEKVIRNGQSVPQFKYDINITSKEPNSPYLWDYFHCKSLHILEEACEMISLDWGNVYHKVNEIYYEGEIIRRYGGNIPDSFIKTVDTQIKQTVPKQIISQFFCGGERKKIVFNVRYEVSDIYIDNGIQTDVSVYCSQVLVDGEPLENIPQDLAETIVGYISENDDMRVPLDDVVWNNITKYMDLAECEIWTHTYTYIRNIGDIEIKSFDYTSHSTFSSKLCDFISGDY